MKRGLSIAVISAMLSLLSCSKERISGNGSTITETRNISNFTAISASGSTNVYINQGAAFRVEVKGYSNLLPYYETRLVNNSLQVVAQWFAWSAGEEVGASSDAGELAVVQAAAAKRAG